MNGKPAHVLEELNVEFHRNRTEQLSAGTILNKVSGLTQLNYGSWNYSDRYTLLIRYHSTCALSKIHYYLQRTLNCLSFSIRSFIVYSAVN